MQVLTSDFEVTTHNNGNPFDVRNKAVCLAWKWNNEQSHCHFSLHAVKFFNVDLYVFFNAKFDLHWYRKCNIPLPKKIWCCQLAEFVLEGQKNKYPSLNQAAEKYGLGQKVDVVATEYWDKGINTDEIPLHILEEYACQDVDLTYAIYLKQLEQFQNKPELFKLFKLLCLDLLVLEEMEWNGLVYDSVLCKQKEEAVDAEIQNILTELSAIYPDIPINFNSGDQLSAFLYGGPITEEYKEHVGFFKGGQKAGQPKYQNKEKVHTLPQLVKPLPKSNLKKDGVFKTDEATLRKLKGSKKIKQIIEKLLRLSELEKLNGTYYRGIPAINEEMHWPPGELHGQFNQCTTSTGRLSSSKPNLQNFANDSNDIIVSRYDT